MSELDAYDYDLPDASIARTPVVPRDSARLLVLHRAAGRIEHRRVRDLPEFLRPGDRLVLNDTRVVPARLTGRRTATGGGWSGLFLEEVEAGVWRLIGQTRGRLRPGESLTLLPESADVPAEPLLLDLLACDDEGIWTARVRSTESTWDLLARYGAIPLPGYIGRDVPTPADRDWYQTIYADRPGAAAAPTAGLHFTPELLARCRAEGVDVSRVTLHVGLGTFRPISAASLDEHRMHSEWCEATPETVREIAETRARGGRIVAVGTTTVRTLESASAAGSLAPWSGPTTLFIRPPYRFRSVDALLTNFHLPRSTLLVLVSTLAGRELVLRAYAEARDAGYRFYSYGDAMLIV